MLGGFADTDATESDVTPDGADERTVHIIVPLDESADGVPEELRRFGDYELLAQIATGGMGVVFKARQISLNRLVAVKLIRGGQLARKQDIRRFRTEAEAAANLKHPHIVAIHEIGEHEGRHFFSMDLIEGHNLAALVRDHPLEPARAARLFQTVAEAIAYAHGCGVLHRDLKPSNVMIDAQGQPHVTDFGLAKLLKSDSEHTQTGAVMGSPSYMSPEQARGHGDKVGVRSDVYALGAMLYELLTTRPPFLAATALETMKLVAEREPVAPRSLNPTVPRDLDTICLKCLQKEPAHRYASALELAEELGRFQHGEPIRARPIKVWELGLKWAKRHPARAGLVFVALIAPAIIITVLWVSVAKVHRERNIALQESTRANTAAARAEAEAARATQARIETRQNLYAADVFFAHSAIAAGSLGAAQQALARHFPEPDDADLRGFEWHWLARQLRGESLRVFSGHSNDVMSVAFSPAGRWLASGAQDGWVRLWDCATGQAGPALRAYEALSPSSLTRGHDNFRSVYSVAFSPDGQWLAACSAPGVRLWQMESSPRLIAEKELRARRGLFLKSGELAVAYQWPLQLTATNSAQANWIGFFDSRLEVAAPAWGVTNDFICLSADGRWLAASRHQSVQLWDVRRRVLEKALHAPFKVHRVALSPDGAELAVSYRERSELECWDPRQGRTVARLAGHTALVQRLEFSPDGRLLASASADETIRLWDVATRRELRQWRAHGMAAVCLTFSPDGQWLASGGSDDTVRLWSVAPPSVPPAMSNAASPLVFSPDSRWLISGWHERAGKGPPVNDSTPTSSTLAVWDLETRQPKLLTNAFAADLVFPGAATTLLTARLPGSNATVEVWSHDLATGSAALVLRLPPAASPATCVALRNDGAEVVTGHQDGTLRWWAGQAGELRAHHSVYPAPVEGVRYSPNGRFLMSWTYSPRRMISWDVASRSALATNEFPGPVALAFAFAPDGTECVSGGFARDVRRWDTASLNLRSALPRQHGNAQRLAWSPDARTLAVAGGDGQLQFWHIHTGRPLFMLEEASSTGQEFFDIAFSPDGEWFAACENTGELHLWHGPRK